MDTERLIHELARSTTPVKRLTPPAIRWLQWFLGAAVCLGLGVAAFGLRPDLASAGHNLQYLIQLGATLALAQLSVLSALLLCMPGRAPRSELPMAMLLLWLSALVYAWQAAPTVSSSAGIGCARTIALLAALPGGLLIWMIRRGTILDALQAGFFALLGAGAWGAVGMQLICGSQEPAHLLMWHFLPVLLMGLLGLLLGKFALGWRPSAAPKL